MRKFLFEIIYTLVSIGILNAYGMGSISFEFAILATIIFGFFTIICLINNVVQPANNLMEELEYEEYDECRDNENNLSERLEDDGK